MSITGATLVNNPVINPDTLTGEAYRAVSKTAVEKLRQGLVVSHWAFASAMSEILPYAMEAISPVDAHLALVIPSLNSQEEIARPKSTLSSGIFLRLFRKMIVDNQTVYVPAITYSKYSHSATAHELKEVTTDQILAELDFWTKSHKAKYPNPIDYSDIVELTTIAFLEKGYKIYSATSLRSAEHQYFRIAYLLNDMYVEMILTMDDLFIWGEASNKERKPVLC